MNIIKRYTESKTKEPLWNAVRSQVITSVDRASYGSDSSSHHVHVRIPASYSGDPAGYIPVPFTTVDGPNANGTIYDVASLRTTLLDSAATIDRLDTMVTTRLQPTSNIAVARGEVVLENGEVMTLENFRVRIL